MTRRKKLSTGQVLRPTPLIAVGVVMILMASTLMAGAQPEVPETTEVGSEGNEKYVVEYQDGSEVNTDCGFLQTTCAAAGAVVIDVDESIVLVNIFGHTVVEVELGVSIAIAASAGYAIALPTGSVWLRGWGEVMGGKFSEYHRNGYLEAGGVDDQNCFEAAPLDEAVCTDHAFALDGSSGGNCVRALAQAKASNAVDHAVSQRSTTEVYAAAHTKDKCVSPSALEDAMVKIREVLFPEDDSSGKDESIESSRHSDADCWDLNFDSFPEDVQQNITGAITGPAKDKLNYALISAEAKNGEIEDTTRFLVVEELVKGIERAVASKTYSVCPSS